MTQKGRILITTLGSTGDHYPLIAVGAALIARGHSVCFAATRAFEQDIRDAGLEFLSLPPEWSQEEFALWMRRMMASRTPVELMRLIFRSISPHLPEMISRIEAGLDGRDLLIGSFLTPYLDTVARRRGALYLGTAFAHQIVPEELHPPRPLPSLPAFMPRRVRALWARAGWRAADATVCRIVESETGAGLRRCGIPPLSRFFTAPAREVLVLVEPGLFPPRSTPYPFFHYTGAARWSPRTGTRADLVPAGWRGVPVLSFGSMGYENPGDWIARLLRSKPPHARLILQEGWAGFRPPPGDPCILGVGKVPHECLFAEASAIIHHGGAGTTAAALASGKPQIIVPHVAEQSLWAEEITRLGCGLRLSRKHWPERLWLTLDQLTDDPGFSAKAEALKPLAADKTGPLRAALRVEAALRLRANRDPASIVA